jgi:hypothetical protein
MAIRALVDHYIDAYNCKDIDGMLMWGHGDVVSMLTKNSPFNA